MKLNNILQEQLLNELSERLKRKSSYGAWIDTNTMKIYDIDKEGEHITFIKSHLAAWGIPKNAITKTDDYYTIGFAKGLVRTVYNPKSVLIVDGTSKDLKKVTPIIMATAMQPDVEYVRINKVLRLGDPATNMKTFEMPGDRGQLQFFLGA